MKKYGIVVDSTFYLSEEELTKYDIKRVSLNILEKDQTFKELEVDNQFVFDRIFSGVKLTTSQPSPGEFFDAYEEMLKKGYEKIFVLTLSEPLSGTYQSAKLAQKMLDNPEKVHLFKSQMAAFGNEMLTIELAEMIEAGVAFDDIVSRIDHINEKSHLMFTIENLHFVVMSGRLTRVKGFIGRVLRVKPILHMIKGKLDIFGSQRTHKKVIDDMIEQMKKSAEGFKKLTVRVISVQSPELAKELEERVKETFTNIKLTFTSYLGPVFSTHIGSKGYGLSWSVE